MSEPSQMTPCTALAAMLVDLHLPSDLELSPDGHKLVYSTAPLGQKGEHLKSTLWIADTSIENSASPLTSGLFADCRPRWSPDGKSIAFVSDRARPGRASAIYVVGVDNEEPHVLTPAENESPISLFQWSPNGQYIAYQSSDEQTAEQREKIEQRDDGDAYGENWQYNRLRIVDLSTRQVRTLYAKDKHVTHLVWRFDSKRIIFTTQETPEVESFISGSQFWILDLLDNVVSLVRDFPGMVWGTPVWARNGEHVYFIAGIDERSASCSKAVHRLTLADRSIEEHFGGTDDCAVSVRSSGNGVVMHTQKGMDDYLTYRIGEPVFQLCHADTEIGSWDVKEAADRDGWHTAFVTSDVDTPFEVWSGRIAGPENKAICLSSHGASISKIFKATPRLIKATARDANVELDGLFVSPSHDAPRTPQPTAVLIHGGPYSRMSRAFNATYMYWYATLLHSGYSVLITNYRGNSGRGQAFAKWAQKTGTCDYDDVHSLIGAAADAGLVDTTRMIVTGYSQGGFLSMLSAVRSGKDSTGAPLPWTFKGAICGGGISDCDMMTMTTAHPTWEADINGGAPWLMGKDDVSKRRSSAIWEMRDAENVPPCLIYHGKEDAQVPYSQGSAFHRACLSNGVDVEFVGYPREEHMFKERAHILDIIARVQRFADKHIGS